MDKYDEVAVVIDQHTGRVLAQYRGFGAKEDAISTAKTCKNRVKHFSSISIVTGKDAEKAIKNGKI